MPTEIEVQDKVSKNYAKRYSGNGLVYHRYIVQRMMQPFHYTRHDKLLDVGCGTGFISDCFSEKNITGIDISKGMLELNRHKSFLGDAQDIKFPDEFFDGVICRALLHHLPDPIKGIQEMSRVMKKNGYISILETNQSVLNKWPRELLKMTGRFSKDHKNFHIEELLDIIKSCFSIVKIEYIGYLAYPLGGFPDFIWLPIPKPFMRKLIKLDEKISDSKLKELAFNVHIVGVK